MTQVLQYEKREHVATFTFNRPEAHNALSPEMLCRFADALLDFEADDSLRVAILTGAGTRAFCAGGDLGRTLPLLTGARQAEDEWDRRLLDDPRVMSISSLCTFTPTKPLIAAVHGICVAAGAELLLATDVRIASQDARFAWPEAQRGLIPFAGSLTRLPSQVPYCQAMALMLTGDAIDAQQALRMGLVNQVVPTADVLPLAWKVAARIAANGPLAVREIKKTALAAIGRPVQDGFGLEAASYQVIMATDDAKEGPRAFMERRAPVYRGK